MKMVFVDDFILGLIESTKELGSPFISESIWTEALTRYILGRRGRTQDNREIYGMNKNRSNWFKSL